MGTHSINIPTSELSSAVGVSSVSSGSSDKLLHGLNYQVEVRMQDDLGNSPASSTKSNIFVDLVSEGTQFVSMLNDVSMGANIGVSIGNIEPISNQDFKFIIEHKAGNPDAKAPYNLSLASSLTGIGTQTFALNANNLAASSAVESISHGGSSGDNTLIDGAIYDFIIQSRDTLLNTIVFDTVSNVEIDLSTESPVISYPVASSIMKVNDSILFNMPENAKLNGLRIQFIQTAGPSDPGSPHTLTMGNSWNVAGNKSIPLNLSDLNSITDVASLTGGVNLIDSAVYKIKVAYRDAIGNAFGVDSVLNVTMRKSYTGPSFDNYLNPMTMTSSGSLIKFTTSSKAKPGSVNLTFEHLSGEPDINAPHILTLDNLTELVGQHDVLINVKDLSFGSNIVSVSSGVNDRLVNGANYQVIVAMDELNGFGIKRDTTAIIIMDMATTPIALQSPLTDVNLTSSNLDLSFSLPEVASAEGVKIRILKSENELDASLASEITLSYNFINPQNYNVKLNLANLSSSQAVQSVISTMPGDFKLKEKFIYTFELIYQDLSMNAIDTAQGIHFSYELPSIVNPHFMNSYPQVTVLPGNKVELKAKTDQASWVSYMVMDAKASPANAQDVKNGTLPSGDSIYYKGSLDVDAASTIFSATSPFAFDEGNYSVYFSIQTQNRLALSPQVERLNFTVLPDLVIDPVIDLSDLINITFDFENETTNEIIPDTLEFRISSSAGFNSGSNQVIDVIPGQTLVIRSKIDSNNQQIFEVPQRNPLSELNVNLSEVALYEFDSEYEYLKEGVWVTYDAPVDFLLSKGSNLIVRKVSTEIGFASETFQLYSSDVNNVFDPEVIHNSSAIQVRWLLNSDISVFSEVSTSWILLDSLNQTVFSELDNQKIKTSIYPLAPGLYSFEYQLKNTLNEVLKEDTMDINIENYLKFTIPNLSEDDSKWVLRGLGNKDVSTTDIELFRWNESNSYDALFAKYDNSEAIDTIRAGEGFWFFTETELLPSLNIDYSLSDVSLVMNMDESKWNQVANPFPYKLKVSDYPDYVFYRWDNKTSDYQVISEAIEPFEGAWVQAKSEEFTWVNIPYFNDLGVTAEIIQNPLNKIQGSTSSEWELGLNVRAGSKSDLVNKIGMQLKTDEKSHIIEHPEKLGEFVELSILDGQQSYSQYIHSTIQSSYEYKVSLKSTVEGRSSVLLDLDGFDQLKSQGYSVYLKEVASSSFRELEKSNAVVVNLKGNEFDLIVTRDLLAYQALNTLSAKLEVSQNSSQATLSVVVPDQNSSEIYMSVYDMDGTELSMQSLGYFSGGQYELNIELSDYTQNTGKFIYEVHTEGLSSKGSFLYINK